MPQEQDQQLVVWPQNIQGDPMNTGVGFESLLPQAMAKQDVKISSHGACDINSGDGDCLKVFWLRTLTCAFVPVFVAGYYAGLWAHWICQYDAGGPVPRGPEGGRWAYYTW
jgi:hypothetical protein